MVFSPLMLLPVLDVAPSRQTDKIKDLAGWDSYPSAGPTSITRPYHR
jgi:hypothetical protein